jgi:hypothetical protein
VHVCVGGGLLSGEGRGDGSLCGQGSAEAVQWRKHCGHSSARQQLSSQPATCRCKDQATVYDERGMQTGSECVSASPVVRQGCRAARPT